MRNEKIDRSVLPKGREEEVLAVLRSEHAYDALFRLNDQPAIDEFFAKYREKKGLDRMMVQTLERCNAPFILDELAPSLYEGPDFEMRKSTLGGELHVDQGYAMTTAKMMSYIIAKAPEFPEAVRKSVGKGVGPKGMRTWWEENQQALREGRYGEVSLVNGAQLPPPTLPNPEDSKRVLPALPVSANATSPTVTPSPLASAPTAVGETAPTITPSRFPLLVGIAAILTGAAWLFLRSRKKT